MQDIPQETHHETTRLTQSALVVLWEIDLTEVGGERYFFCNEQNEKGEPVTWQGRQYQAYPIQGTGFELNGKGSAARPTLTVSNLHGMVTGMAEDLQSLVGGTVVRRKVYARFLDAVNFVNGNSDADPEQEVISRWRIEQCSELSAVSASFVLSTPTETDGAVFPGRIMLANTCTWTYRGDECGYHGPAVADAHAVQFGSLGRTTSPSHSAACSYRAMIFFQSHCAQVKSSCVPHWRFLGLNTTASGWRVKNSCSAVCVSGCEASGREEVLFSVVISVVFSVRSLGHFDPMTACRFEPMDRVILRPSIRSL